MLIYGENCSRALMIVRHSARTSKWGIQSWPAAVVSGDRRRSPLLDIQGAPAPYYYSADYVRFIRLDFAFVILQPGPRIKPMGQSELLACVL